MAEMESAGQGGSMCEPWNLWDLQCPPMCTVKTLIKYSEIRDMKNTINSAISNLKKLSALHKEAAFLSRFLYKFKRLFRHDKGTQHLVKVNQALHRYLRLNVKETLSQFREYLPSKLPKDGSQDYLPTRQMLKWVLLRIEAFAAIFVRIIEESKNAGKFIYSKLCLGWSASYMTFALALTSRILACAKFAVMSAIEWYDGLRVLLPALEETADYVGHYQFPENLTEVIGDVDLRPPTKKTDIDKIFELIDLTEANDDENEDDVIITNEIILNTIDSDSDVEISSDKEEIIVEETRTPRSKKRCRSEEDIAVIHENIKKGPVKSLHFAKAVVLEDLGKPVTQVKIGRRKTKKKKKKQHGSS